MDVEIGTEGKAPVTATISLCCVICGLPMGSHISINYPLLSGERTETIHLQSRLQAAVIHKHQNYNNRSFVLTCDIIARPGYPSPIVPTTSLQSAEINQNSRLSEIMIDVLKCRTIFTFNAVNKYYKVQTNKKKHLV